MKLTKYQKRVVLAILDQSIENTKGVQRQANNECLFNSERAIKKDIRQMQKAKRKIERKA